MIDINGLTVKTAIIEALSLIPGIGVIHDRERFIKSFDKLKELYLTEGKEIRGGFVRRASFSRRRSSSLYDDMVETWTIRLYRSFIDTDASELQFDRLCEAVPEVILWHDGLPKIVRSITSGDEKGPQLVSSAPVLFCGALCHSAEFRLVTTRRLACDVMALDLDALRKTETTADEEPPVLTPHPSEMEIGAMQWNPQGIEGVLLAADELSFSGTLAALAEKHTEGEATHE